MGVVRSVGGVARFSLVTSDARALRPRTRRRRFTRRPRCAPSTPRRSFAMNRSWRASSSSRHPRARGDGQSPSRAQPSRVVSRDGELTGCRGVTASSPTRDFRWPRRPIRVRVSAQFRRRSALRSARCPRGHGVAHRAHRGGRRGVRPHEAHSGPRASPGRADRGQALCGRARSHPRARAVPRWMERLRKKGRWRRRRGRV